MLAVPSPWRQAQLDTSVKACLTVKPSLTSVVLAMTIKTKIRRVASRLPGKNWLRKSLYCSFCGKSQHDVAKLIAGPSVFICDECVGMCNKVIEVSNAPGGEWLERHRIEDIESMSTERLLHWLKIQGLMSEHVRSGMQDAVDTLRKREVSWAAIGEALGVSRQAAWDRFS